MKYSEDSAEFLQRLRAEMGSWVEKGLISHEQRERILSHYSTVQEIHAKAGSGKLVTVVSVLGSVLVGLGIILFVAANWHFIPKYGKLGLLFSAMLGSYGTGYYLRYLKESYPKVGGSLIFLGTISFGANIYLIAQIFHISVHYPNGELLWVLGTLPLAYLLRFRTVLTLTLINLLIWLGMEASFRLRDPYSLSMTAAYIPLYMAAGMTLTAIGLMHRASERYALYHGPYLWLGTFVTMSCWYVFTFRDMFTTGYSAPSLAVFYAGMCGIFICAAAAAFVRDRGKTKWIIPEVMSLVLLMAAVLVLAFFNPGVVRQYQYGSEIRSSLVTALSVISNILFAGAIIGMIVLGFVRRAAFYINTGLLFFVLDVLARYFDFFWKMLPRSLFFIIGGLMLIFGSVLLERKRKRVLASFSVKEEL